MSENDYHDQYTRHLGIEGDDIAEYRKARSVMSAEIKAKKESEKQLTAKEYADKVTRRQIHGKIETGTVIDGKTVEKGSASFRDYGEGSKEKSWDYDNFGAQFATKMSENDPYGMPAFPELAGKQIVVFRKSTIDESKGVVTIHFMQKAGYVPESRPQDHPASVEVEMPYEVAKKFIKGIEENPQLLEEFYQEKIGKELDGKGEKSQRGTEGYKPGIRRKETDGFFVISEEDIPRLKGDRTISNGYITEEHTREIVKRLKLHSTKPQS